MPKTALVLVAAAVLRAREKPSTYSSRRPGRQVPTMVDQVVSVASLAGKVQEEDDSQIRGKSFRAGIYHQGTRERVSPGADTGVTAACSGITWSSVVTQWLP
jgi:hypothetical protein